MIITSLLMVGTDEAGHPIQSLLSSPLQGYQVAYGRAAGLTR